MGTDDVKLTQLCENMRFYGEMRFKQLTLLMAGMTAAGAGVAQYPLLKVPLAFAGMLFTSVMWVMEVRSTLYGVAHREAAPQLWPCPSAVRFRWLNATNAVLFLHMAFYAFWLWCGALWHPSCLLLILGIGLAVLLLVFSIANYWPLWKWHGARKEEGRAALR